jgi:hypothetical protein
MEAGLIGLLLRNIKEIEAVANIEMRPHATRLLTKTVQTNKASSLEWKIVCRLFGCALQGPVRYGQADGFGARVHGYHWFRTWKIATLPTLLAERVIKDSTQVGGANRLHYRHALTVDYD